MIVNSVDSQTLSRALVLIDEVWQIQSKLPYFSREPGALSCLPQLSEASTIARSEKAAALLAKLDSLDAARLPSMKAGRNTPRRLRARWACTRRPRNSSGAA